LSHRFKGAFANLRINVIAQPGTEINDLAKSGKELKLIKQLSLKIQDAFEQLIKLF
jgi:hypothetical protein